MSDTGYVAAAYLVLLALLLIYFGIMAAKLARISRDVEALADAVDGPPPAPAPADEAVVQR